MDVPLVQICDNMPLDAFSDTELDELAEYARGQGVAVQPGTRGIGRDHLSRYLKIAKKFGSGLVRTLTDTKDHEPGTDEIVGLLKASAPDYKDAGILLAVENHDRLSTSDFVSIMKQVDSPSVGLCLDTVNSFGSLEGPETVIDRLLPYTVNLHVKDFRIYREPHKMGFRIEGTPAGEGRLDIRGLFARIRASGRETDAILELWTPPVGGIRETIQREKDWAKRSISYLRGII